MTEIGDATAVPDEVVVALRSQLRATQEELSRQNEELATLQSAVAADARRMQLLFDAAPIAFLTTDRNGIVTAANVAAGTLLDARPLFLLGKPLAGFVEPGHRRAFRTELPRIRPRARLDIPIRMRRRDGVAFEARASAIGVEDEILWTIADQTLLAQADDQVWQLNRELEERVAERTAELEGLLEQLPIGVALVTRHGAVTWLNDRGREIIGRQATRLDQLFPDGARTAEGRELDRDAYPAARARRGEYVRDARITTTRGDGAPLTVDVTAAPHGAGGVVVVFEDATTQARREEADRRFVSNAAHQIRTPITIIASVVAALQAGGRDDPEARDRFIEHIEGAVGRLAGLAEALLTLARIQRGGERTLAIVPLLPVVDEVVAGRVVDVDDDVDVDVDVDDELAILGDRALLVEALSNVVDNAFEHGGAAVEIGAHAEGRRVVIDVRDHGAGIPQRDRAGALERFATTGRGAGLGLPIAHEATLALGGTLTLDDAEGGGLRVRLDLPGAKLL